MWRLDPEHASFSVGPLRGKVSPAQPQRGVYDLEIAGGAWPGAELLQVGLPAESEAQVAVSEAYLREEDLVATYAPLPPFTVQPQIYWRLRTSDAHRAVGVELILSVKTSLLFSEPQTKVACRFAAGDAGSQPEMLLTGDDAAGVLAVRMPPGQHVCVHWIHPSDFHSLDSEQMPDGGLRFQARLFQEHLEKGVIRRARVWAWFLPADDWRSNAEGLLAMLRSEAPPLTV